SIIAATVLTILPEMLRQFNSYRMLLYAIVLILIMLATNNDVFKGHLRNLCDRLLPKNFRKGRKGAENGQS
ncbi:MAG: branched-chain amino acid ABC transporter permease, partial [Oscillospiraceae bacterium]|nr:branched-chain amino acid ABC transporter permease [Oscillospiraceae bacterium]